MKLLLFCRRKDLHTPLSVECDSDVQVGVGIDVVFAIWVSLNPTCLVFSTTHVPYSEAYMDGSGTLFL